MKGKIISWVLVILWMTLIFYQSHKPAIESNEISKGITVKIIEVVKKLIPNIDIDAGRFNHIIRKGAHFFVYLVLGVLVANGLIRCDVTGSRLMCFALLICVLYAIGDEAHQLFIPGRGGQVRDVILDSVGSLVGILSYWWLMSWHDLF